MEVGTGWIGWTEEQTLDTSIPAIEMAYRGRCKMLNAIFGGGDDTPTPSNPASVNMAAQLDAFAKVTKHK